MVISPEVSFYSTIPATCKWNIFINQNLYVELIFLSMTPLKTPPDGSHICQVQHCWMDIVCPSLFLRTLLGSMERLRWEAAALHRPEEAGGSSILPATTQLCSHPASGPLERPGTGETGGAVPLCVCLHGTQASSQVGPWEQTPAVLPFIHHAANVYWDSIPVGMDWGAELTVVGKTRPSFSSHRGYYLVVSDESHKLMKGESTHLWLLWLQGQGRKASLSGDVKSEEELTWPGKIGLEREQSGKGREHRIIWKWKKLVWLEHRGRERCKRRWEE